MRIQVRLIHLTAMVVAGALVSAFVAAVVSARTAARASQCISTRKFLIVML